MKLDGISVEDGHSLHPHGSSQHINLAELVTVLRGINLELQWKALVLQLLADLACVHQWISDTLRDAYKMSAQQLWRSWAKNMT